MRHAPPEAGVTPGDFLLVQLERSGKWHTGDAAALAAALTLQGKPFRGWIARNLDAIFLHIGIGAGKPFHRRCVAAVIPFPEMP